MMYRFNYFLWVVLFLMIFIGFGSPVGAQESSNPGPEETVKQLREKQEHEERELKRLSEMMVIPAGDFVMGRNSVNDNEEPAHTVHLNKFYIDKYEVTQLQYLSAIGKNPSYFGECPLCPVEKVTFHQASEYCARVGKRLPTEAEWEKAARGGTTGWYYWDQDNRDLYAWYGNNAGKRTRPVGTRDPNKYGIHDMAGNVWEWVQDWYDSNYYPKSPQRNPKGPETGKTKVTRGGSWGNTPAQIAHPYRDSREPRTRYINGGFRCAKDARKQ